MSSSGSSKQEENYNPVPQAAPGASAAVGHCIDNSIPLSIFPIATDKFCICFCGLPGRGKTHISRRLGRYLQFFHAVPVGIFNVSEYRRKFCGALKDAEWFDPTNKEAQTLRSQTNSVVYSDLVKFLSENSNGVAILDSTNHSHERRTKLLKLLEPTGAKVLWVEVSNTDERYLSELYRTVASRSPDYAGIEDIKAEEDYRRRVGKYESIFEPIDADLRHPVESLWSYFKCDHSQQHFVVHRVRGYLPLKVVHFIMNLHTSQHTFFLSRHGQSEYNAIGRIGGDSGLSPHGLGYARKLAEFVDEKVAQDGSGKDVPARLWTSTMRRTKETAQFIKQNMILIEDYDDKSRVLEWIQMRPKHWHHLDELFAGACDGMTYEEIEEHFPEEFARREADKLAYRYPRGESYLDVIARLEPIIIEMERHREPLLIIGHQGILRIIYAFYMGLTRNEAPYVSIPLNTVVQLDPHAFTCTEQRHTLYVPHKPLASDGQDEPTRPSDQHDHTYDVDPQSH